MEKLGRNELCHCGSAKKYKNCHQLLDGQRGNRNKSIILGSIIGLLLLIFVVTFFINTNSSGNGAPGPAPEGKVWSEAHGHWHDA